MRYQLHSNFVNDKGRYHSQGPWIRCRSWNQYSFATRTEKLHSGDGISVAGSSNIELMVDHLVQHQVVYFWGRFASYQKESYFGGLATIPSGTVDENVVAESSGFHQPQQLSTIVPNVSGENKGLPSRTSGSSTWFRTRFYCLLKFVGVSCL